MAEALNQLEKRVISRYAELVTKTIPPDIFNPEDWLYGDTDWAAPQQFPREQWVTYSNRRTIALNHRRSLTRPMGHPHSRTTMAGRLPHGLRRTGTHRMTQRTVIGKERTCRNL